MFTVLLIVNVLVLLAYAMSDTYQSVETHKKFSPDEPINRTSLLVHRMVKPFKQNTARTNP